MAVLEGIGDAAAYKDGSLATTHVVNARGASFEVAYLAGSPESRLAWDALEPIPVADTGEDRVTIGARFERTRNCRRPRSSRARVRATQTLRTAASPCRGGVRTDAH